MRLSRSRDGFNVATLRRYAGVVNIFVRSSLNSSRRRKLALGGLFFLGLFCFLHLGGDGVDYSRPARWGLVDDSLRQARIYPLRMSVIQAVIKPREQVHHSSQFAANYIEILTFFEQPSPNRDYSHEVLKLSRLDRLYRTSCNLDVPGMNLFANVTAAPRIPAPPSALILHCPVPDHWQRILGLDGTKRKSKARRLNVQLVVTLTETSSPLIFDLPMRPYHPPLPKPSQLGICLMPFRGSAVDTSRLLEWREHHRLLGIGPVHWYLRDSAQSAWVKAYEKRRKQSDTLRIAHLISPEGYDRWQKTFRGPDEDQLLYYLDCAMRSSYLAPTPFLTLISLDEVFWPDQMPAERPHRQTVMHNLLSPLKPSLASLQLLPTYPSGEVHLGAGKGSHFTPFFQHIDSVRLPQPDDPWTSARAIHRVNAVELANATAALDFYSAGSATARLVNSPIWLMDTKAQRLLREPATTFHHTPNVVAYARELSKAVGELISRLPANG